ncbi:MAG: 3'-5' exonuclease, partial [Acidimicrobiia bacterium]
ASDEQDEAAFVAEQMRDLESDGIALSDVAVFYRTNAQSRVIEEVLVRYGLPYQVVGGPRYYDRREVKDAVAYLRAVVTPDDQVAIKRIINVPRRAIGNTSVGHVDRFAEAADIGFMEALRQGGANERLTGRAQRSIAEFVSLLDHLRDRIGDGPRAVTEAVLEETGYLDMIRAERTIEAMGREENLRELVSAVAEFEESGPISVGPTDWEGLEPIAKLQMFLESISLVADIDGMEDTEKATLMTLHNAKGLEFPAVFLTGMEDGVFPHMRSLGDPAQLEEERRLCYVGITRAEERLFLTRAWNRNLWGQSQYNGPSRFLGEIPESLIRKAKRTEQSIHAAASASHPTVSDTDIISGDRVRHAHWGDGVVREVVGTGDRAEAVVTFDEGDKRLLLAWAPLEKA